MDTNNEYSWITSLSYESHNNYNILNYDINKRILIVSLYGTIIDKINIIRKLDGIESIEVDKRIAIYTGIINSEIKEICKEKDIKLIKSMKFIGNGIQISMSPIKSSIRKPMEKNLRRSKEEIKRDVLGIISNAGEINITHIVYKCNLNYSYCEDMLTKMVKEKLLDIQEGPNSIKYKITPIGLDYLSKLHRLF